MRRRGSWETLFVTACGHCMCLSVCVRVSRKRQDVAASTRTYIRYTKCPFISGHNVQVQFDSRQGEFESQRFDHLRFPFVSSRWNTDVLMPSSRGGMIFFRINIIVGFFLWITCRVFTTRLLRVCNDWSRATFFFDSMEHGYLDVFIATRDISFGVNVTVGFFPWIVCSVFSGKVQFDSMEHGHLDAFSDGRDDFVQGKFYSFYIQYIHRNNATVAQLQPKCLFFRLHRI